MTGKSGPRRQPLRGLDCTGRTPTYTHNKRTTVPIQTTNLFRLARAAGNHLVYATEMETAPRAAPWLWAHSGMILYPFDGEGRPVGEAFHRLLFTPGMYKR
jgi:hypothetical protein